MLRKVLFLVLLGVRLAAGGSGQVWTEEGDARSFPDHNAQVTRGAGALTSIVGATSASDLRDAYCIKIVEPAGFLATTDPNTAPGAGATFNTRLLLFSPSSEPLLANDDTAPSDSPFLSTLVPASTDGSGFVLTRPGEYVLVVAGFHDDPHDRWEVASFALDENPDLVLTPDRQAGHVTGWEGFSTHGDYSVALSGVEHCQDQLDAVVGGSNNFVDEMPFRLCGDVGKASTDCRTIDAAGGSIAAARGFVNGDSHLDVVFANDEGPAVGGRVCLGGASGRFACSEVETTEPEAPFNGVALGFVNADLYLDAVFVGSSAESCLGDGQGGFACSGFEGAGDRVALGFLDRDSTLDAIIVDNSNTAQSCLGDGDGGFTCTGLVGLSGHRGVALADFTQNGRLDAILVEFEPKICIGDGHGDFDSCTAIPAVEDNATAVAIGYLNQDDFKDAVFTGVTGMESRNSICLGDGLGGFSCAQATVDQRQSWDVALGLVDEDQYLDVVFANRGLSDFDPAKDVVCFGDGVGGLESCVDLNSDSFPSHRVVLGDFGGATLFEDGFESGDTSAWSTVVP